MPRLVIEDRRTDPQPVKVSCSCLGCLVTILVLIALAWMAFHVTDIVNFITT